MKTMIVTWTQDSWPDPGSPGMGSTQSSNQWQDLREKMNLTLILVCWQLCIFVHLFGYLMSSSATRLYCGGVQRLTSDNFTCCPTWDKAVRPWFLSQLVTLYCHRPNQQGAGGYSGNQTQDLLVRSGILYQLNYHAPRQWCTNRLYVWYKKKGKTFLWQSPFQITQAVVYQ